MARSREAALLERSPLGRATQRAFWGNRPGARHDDTSRLVEALCVRLSSLTRMTTCWTDRVNKIRCRPAGTEDFTVLAAMLGEAAVWRPDKATPTAEQVMADPRYAMYLAGWPRQGNYGLVAEQDGPVGAAWYRRYTEANHGYGFIAEDVPELSIAVIASRRAEGIGRRLLIDLVEASVAQGCRALSLSVAENNPARGLYESTGFVPVERHGHSWTMVRHAAQSS